MNGIINEAVKLKKNIDITILDYRQCFDSMWLEETVNDLFETGLQNDNLNIIYKLNGTNKVAVVTPHGLTERVEINKIVMQGENLAPLECSVQVDTFGKECMNEKKYLFNYRKTVEIPPLSMVDDLLCVSSCGIKSVLMNSFIKSKSNMKKLQFGEKKCNKIHVGCDQSVCPSLSVDKWKVKHIEQIDIGKSSLEDVHDGYHEIEDKSEEKYLGDIISKNGKNDKNIESRVKKGHGIMKQIISILEEICFGKNFFTVFIILRDSLFINSILLNSEVWYSMSKSNIEELEKVDNILLKKVLEVPSSTPTAMIHLELGTIPIRFIIKTRRLMFLQYLLQENENSLLYKFLSAQIDDPKEGDWWLYIIQDIKDLNLQFTLHEIKLMTKKSFKAKVKLAAKQKALKWLNDQKEGLNKVKEVAHDKLELQPYFNSSMLSTKQIKFLFTLRSRMLFVRGNFRHMYKDEFCPLCSKPGQGNQRFRDSQQHLLKCSLLNSSSSVCELDMKYEDIFLTDRSKQEKMTILLDDIYQKRKQMEEK